MSYLSPRPSDCKYLEGKNNICTMHFIGGHSLFYVLDPEQGLAVG